VTLTGVLRTAQKFVTDNSPGILTGLGVAGVVTTAVLTGKASVKASERIKLAQDLENEETVQLTKFQTAILVWDMFLPPVVVGAATITCIISANQLGARRAAAIAAAFKITEEMAGEYRAKVVESIGTKAEEKLQTQLAADRMERTPGREVIILTGPQTIFFDAFSGRYFSSEMETIKKAINEINFQINGSFYASLSDFYDKIGLERTEISDEFGWNSDNQLEVSFTPILMSDNKVAIQMSYNKQTIRGYDRVQ
jgi:hypothetical protein